MSIKICRIDDRLIHGQVVTSWLNIYQVAQIIIVSSTAVNDKVQMSVLKMSAPANVALHFFSPEKFLEVVSKSPIKKATMLLFDSVYDLEKVIMGDFEIKDLNVGGLRLNDQREKISKQVSVSEDERECFKRLLDKGMSIEIRMVPSDTKINLKEVI